MTDIVTPLCTVSSGGNRCESVSNGLVDGGGRLENEEFRGVMLSSVSLAYGDWPYENGDDHAKTDFFSGCGSAIEEEPEPFIVEEYASGGSGSGS